MIESQNPATTLSMGSTGKSSKFVSPSNYVVQPDNSPQLKPPRRRVAARRMTGVQEKITWWFKKHQGAQEASSPAKPTSSACSFPQSPDMFAPTPDTGRSTKKTRRTGRKKKEAMSTGEDPKHPPSTPQVSSSPAKHHQDPSFPTKQPQNSSSQKLQKRLEYHSLQSSSQFPAKKTGSTTEVAAAPSPHCQLARQEEERKDGRNVNLG